MLKVQNSQRVLIAPPANYTGAVCPSVELSMKLYDKVQFVIMTGAWAAGTAAVTLEQGTDIAFGTNKALGFTLMWTNNAAVASPQLVATAVVGNTFNVANVANATYIIEVDADTLDQDGGFDCVRLAIASPGANADFYCAYADLYTARYAAAVMPSSVID